jgi:carbamoyltransferase
VRILGISAFYHDSAACLLADGRLVAAAQEERFTRKKHDFEFPDHAIDYVLKAAGIMPATWTT